VEADQAMANLLMALYRGLQLHKAIDPTVDTEGIFNLLAMSALRPAETRSRQTT
jgi:hypothetical protein